MVFYKTRITKALIRLRVCAGWSAPVLFAYTPRRQVSRVEAHLTTQLEIDVSNIKIERAHRLPSKYTARPGTVKVSHFKNKERVLKVYREKKVKINKMFSMQARLLNASESNTEGIIALKASGRDCTNNNELLHKVRELQRYAM